MNELVMEVGPPGAAFFADTSMYAELEFEPELSI
jgi:hypothetical protein